jgi:hypothetical protein
MVAKLRETDLYPPVKRFLEAQGYVVKAEIGACDVLAVRGAEPPVIVELKIGFTLQLLYQAIDRQKVTDLVYVCVPAPKKGFGTDELGLCKRLGVGLLTVKDGWVEPHLDPAPFVARKQKPRQQRLLKEFHRRVGDPNAGGSTRRPLMTAYRQDALRCAEHLHRLGASRVCDVVAATQVARAASIFRSDVYGWFEKVDRGIYATTPKAQAALSTYADVVAAIVPKSVGQIGTVPAM